VFSVRTKKSLEKVSWKKRFKRVKKGFNKVLYFAFFFVALYNPQESLEKVYGKKCLEKIGRKTKYKI
jgi:hypothetical protein